MAVGVMAQSGRVRVKDDSRGTGGGGSDGSYDAGQAGGCRASTSAVAGPPHAAGADDATLPGTLQDLGEEQRGRTRGTTPLSPVLRISPRVR